MGIAIEQLMKEHAAIERMLVVLDAVCRRLESGEGVEPGHLDQVVAFFRGFADECHHEKEETVLFPALEKAGIPREGGPLGVMLHEHDQMRGYLRGLATAVERLRAGEVGAAMSLARNAGHYANTLRLHMDKENSALFRMAEMRLGPAKEEQLAEQFEAIETQKMGEGKHEELHALLDRLEEIYLPGQSS